MGQGGHLETLQKKLVWQAVFWIAISGGFVLFLFWAIDYFTDFDSLLTLAIVFGLWIGLSGILGTGLVKRSIKPLAYLNQAILHLSPTEHLTEAPNLDDLKSGKELISSLTRQVYELASSQPKNQSDQSSGLISQIPVPIIGLDEQQNIVFANQAANTYLMSDKPLAGANFYSAVDLDFTSQDTLDNWLNQEKAKSVSSAKSWERVRVNLAGKTKYIDLAAQFSKHNQSGIETLLIMFDHTTSYQVADDSLTFIALAVHELRTPLTALRGYIEVFEDEIGPTLNPEHADFMRKMEASAESLASFVNNILNVARVDQNQLSLKLTQADWATLVNKSVQNMRLRAETKNLSLEVNIAQGLPPVAADPITIVEVINNLIENAIKYSKPDSKKIIVTTGLGKDGVVQTTVQDFGLGIPESVTGELFNRFSRNFRTRTSVSGTGLGLFLSKTIVSAHGGNIWVRSTVGEGSTFGFSVLPYDKVANPQQNSDNNDMTRTAHGWIKNHSMYRR